MAKSPTAAAGHSRRQATYVQNRTSAGDKKVTFWLTPQRMRALDRLAGVTGSRQKALDRVIDLLEVGNAD